MGMGGWRVTFKRYRSRRLVEAKQMDHAGSFYDPRSGRKEDFQSGDYVVREPSGHQRIEKGETFQREYEAVD